MPHGHQRRATDVAPLRDIVTKVNLDDRLATVGERMDGHWTLDDERWIAHKELHLELARALGEYKTAANEWRGLVSDRGAELAQLRADFLTRGEFASEHKALQAQLHGEIESVSTVTAGLDTRIDGNTSDIKTINTDRDARRGLFSDSRNVILLAIAALGILLAIWDRLPHP